MSTALTRSHRKYVIAVFNDDAASYSACGTCHIDVLGSVTLKELNQLAALFETENIEIRSSTDGTFCLVKVRY